MKLCLIYNTAPRYREAIFRAIDAEYDCDWYFGKTKLGIKEMDTTQLKNVHYYKTYGNPNHWCWKWGVLRLLFRRQYQVFFMVAETRSITDWVFFWLATTFFHRKKVYIWTHGWYGKESKQEAKMKLWLYKNVSGIFLYGDYARDLLIKEGISAEKLFTIHNSLDYAAQMTIRETLLPSDLYYHHFHNNDKVIIFIGRLTPVKQLDLLIEALAFLNEKKLFYNLVLVGDGECKDALQALAVKRNVEDRIWFYGACYEEATNAELIYNADVCVSPGNVGLTAMHSLVFGTPVITHNDFKWQMPEFESITESVTGSFFEKGNVVSLANTIERWIQKHGNEREKVRKDCFYQIDNFWTPYFQMGVIRKYLKF